jgi:hypothetical protein
MTCTRQVKWCLNYNFLSSLVCHGVMCMVVLIVAFSRNCEANEESKCKHQHCKVYVRLQIDMLKAKEIILLLILLSYIIYIIIYNVYKYEVGYVLQHIEEHL